MNKLVWTLAPALLAGCGVLSPKPPPAPAHLDAVKTDPSFRATAVGKRPAVLGLAREGDPYPVVAVAVRVAAGPVLGTGLAAIVDARLARAKIPAETHVTRHGFDVRIAVRDGVSEAAMRQAVLAVRMALLTPIAGGTKETDDDLKLAAARVTALRAQVVDDDALTEIVACSGELRLTRAEAKPESLVVSAASLESARTATIGDATVAMGIVGPRAALEAAQKALSAEPEWPTAAPAKAVWPRARSEGAYVRGDRGPSLLSVALRVPVRSAALRVAERAADPSSPLVARLRALPTPFRTRRVAATVHEEGGCVTVEAESDPRTGTASGDAAVAASAALVIEHELLAELAERADDAVASAQIRALSDPREAAAAAANWALSRDAGAGGSAAPVPTLPAFAFGASAPKAKEEPAAVASAFSAALAEGERAWSRSAIENRVAVEQSQGQLWLLLASPCPLPEPSAHAGLTALTLDALASSGVHQGVSVEPWIAPDGHGLLVHAARQPNETGEALATRVSNAAARLLALDPPSPPAVVAARTALLPRLSTPADEARALLATALFPAAITRVIPWGSAASVGRLEGADARVRWGGFATGPLRAAVLANEDSAQATSALRAIDRWIPRTNRPRACAAVDDGKIAADPLVFPADPNKGVAPVYLVYPFDGTTTQARLGASWLAAIVSGDGSPVGTALAPATRASAVILGRGAGSLLVIELAPPVEATDAGIASARAAVAKIAADPLATPRAAEGKARLADEIEARRLSPKERVIGLWRGDTTLTLPGDADLKTLAATVLRDESARIVRSAVATKP